jgi:ferric-dicitrate binding protein FerR (iron transport regulator)
MDGLVYFEARKVENQPLVVLTDLAENTAFDAIFTIESNAKETIVRVAEGLVELTQNRDNYKGNRTPLNIKPSQIGIIKVNTRGAIKTVNKDRNFLAWADQKLFFQNTSLREVASLLERVYGYQFKFIDITSHKCLLSRSYEKQTPKEIAESISNIFVFDYQIVDRTIIFEGSCL